MGVDKVHFGNQADDQMATTEPTGDMSKPELINFINNQHGVDFDTLQVQVVPGRRKNQFLKASTLIFSLARLFHPQAVLLPNDNSTVYGSSSKSSQKYMLKAAN